MSNATTAALLVSCRDRTGLVAALSDFVFRHDGNILDADQHAEGAEGQNGFFFMRLRWDLGRFQLDEPSMREALCALAAFRRRVPPFRRGIHAYGGRPYES